MYTNGARAALHVLHGRQHVMDRTSNPGVRRERHSQPLTITRTTRVVSQPGIRRASAHAQPHDGLRGQPATRLPSLSDLQKVPPRPSQVPGRRAARHRLANPPRGHTILHQAWKVPLHLVHAFLLHSTTCYGSS